MHTLIYGIGTGVALIILSLILYITNMYMNKILGYLTYLILIAGMVVGSLQYRKVQLNGFMTYGQAFKTSFLIGLFASIISAIFTFFYVKYINTGLIEEILTLTRQKIEAKAGTMSQEQIDQAMSWTERFMTPVWITILGFLGFAFWSAIIALVISFFLKKKDPNAQPLV